jgi:hypothetical protein
MNKQAIPLGRVLGIPIGLDYSWFLIFALLTWSLAVSYYPAEFPRWPAAQYWIVGAATAILMFELLQFGSGPPQRKRRRTRDHQIHRESLVRLCKFR